MISWLFAGLQNLKLSHSIDASSELLECIGRLTKLLVLYIGKRPRPRMQPCLQTFAKMKILRARMRCAQSTPPLRML
jgi:hypothetical protein